MNFRDYITAFMLQFAIIVSSPHANLTIWVNNGEDKVTKDELRACANADSVHNSLWNGSQVSLFGARNEVISFNVILESPGQTTSNIKIYHSSLRHSDGFTIAGRDIDPQNLADDLFDYRGRNIELFYVRYLQIKGLSKMSYHSSYYDERHAPRRFQRPMNSNNMGQGTWYDRPDHDKFYPDIAVPVELHIPFSVPVDENQSIWIDIFIPKNASIGKYTGTITIEQGGDQVPQKATIPVILEVKNFTLPDIPYAKTMLYGSDIDGDAAYRYTGEAWPNPGSAIYEKMVVISQRHSQMAHRHKISLIRGTRGTPDDLTAEAMDQLTGTLFTAGRKYDGPGINTGVNLLSIGTYGSWKNNWFQGANTEEEKKQAMWTHADTWVNWFKAQNFTTPTEYFLYLIDESSDYALIEKWAKWLKDNPGPGKELMSYATIHARNAQTKTPSLNIASSWKTINVTGYWQETADHFINDPQKKLHLYNGCRRERGSFATEDDGISLRVTAWAQFKKKIDRWFFWESTYYDDFQSGSGQTNVFQSARTYGADTELQVDGHAFGRTGWNYSNGDGLLMYPGTDTHFSEENYGINGPIASLRLKHWRRGIQDVDYLGLATSIDPVQTNAIIQRIIPKVLWEYGKGEASDPNDPTWVKHAISWSDDPDIWEAARAELAAIIEKVQNISYSGQGFSTILFTGAYPNPFQHATSLSFSLPARKKVSITVHNAMGKRVKTLCTGRFLTPGHHKIQWQGTDDNQRQLVAGIYFVRIQTDHYHCNQKVSLMR